MMRNIFKFCILFSACTPFVLFSMEMLPIELIAKIVTIPDFETLSNIIQEKQKSRDLPRFKSVYSSSAVQNALFSGYALLLTCKFYYAIDKKQLKNCTDNNNFYRFFPPGIPLFIFPKNMQSRLKNRYYPNVANSLLRALYIDNLFYKPDDIKKYIRNINGNTIIVYKSYPVIKLCTLFERVIECMKNFMQNSHALVFLNCIAVLDYLCCLKETRLSVCGVNDCDKSLARYIFDILHNSRYQEIFSRYLSEEAQNQINHNCTLEKGEFPESMLLENKPIIEELIATYLRFVPEQETIKKNEQT